MRSAALAGRLDQFDFFLQDQVHEGAERHATLFCARLEIGLHLRLQVDGRDQRRAGMVETAALAAREIDFVVSLGHFRSAFARFASADARK